MKTFDGVLSVASPCRQKWDEMQGDARVRFCGACSKNVYSLDGMTTAEVRELIVSTEGRLCWRFFVRRDGTVLTRDCPVGLRRVRQRMFGAIATAVALLAASTAGVLREGGLWGLSQKLGAWSEETKANVVEPLVADVRGERMGQAVMDRHDVEEITGW